MGCDIREGSYMGLDQGGTDRVRDTFWLNKDWITD
jgi:hypothetical protein